MAENIIDMHSPHYLDKSKKEGVSINPFNFSAQREAKARQKKVQEIANHIDEYGSMTDEELCLENEKIHQRAANICASVISQIGDISSPDKSKKAYSEIDKIIKNELMPDAFALVAAALKKEKGFTFHKSQIESALVLCDNDIAEMRCGGGKTIMQFLPAYLNTLTLDHHFVITPNEYLKYEGFIEAKRVFDHLGITVGMMPSDIHKRDEVKKEANKTIVYGCADTIAHSIILDRLSKPNERVMPSEKMSASIDEIDQIVLDSATTPFVIGQGQLNSNLVEFAQGIVSQLSAKQVVGLPDVKDLRNDSSGQIYDAEKRKFLFDLVYDEKNQDYQITDAGDEKIYQILDNSGFYKSLSDADKEYMNVVIQNAIRANYLFKNNVSYVVKDKKILVYSKDSGRVKQSSTYSKGIQQALEAKEGLKITDESNNKDSMTILDVIHCFDKVSGCSGTVKELEDYFGERFGKNVREIKAESGHMIDEAPIYFLSSSAKMKYIVDDIVGRKKGTNYMSNDYNQNPDEPIMIVSSSLDEAKALDSALRSRNISHNLLTADNSTEEMEIFAQSGSKDAVTISTLMAGRGTDIILGGSPSKAALADITKILNENKSFSDEDISRITAGLDGADKEIIDSNDPKIKEIVVKYESSLIKYKNLMKDGKKEVNDIGGLCVISTDFVDSDRSQRQLLSRAGRQTDNGRSVQFVSFEDEAIKPLLGSSDVKKIESMLKSANLPLDTPITPDLGNIYSTFQKIVSSCRERNDLNKCASVLNNDPYHEIVQREVAYLREMRDYIFTEENPFIVIQKFVEDGIKKNVSKYMPDNNPENWDLAGLKETYRGVLLYDNAFNFTEESLKKLTPDLMVNCLTHKACEKIYNNTISTEEEKSKGITTDSKAQKLLDNYFDYFSELISQSYNDSEIIHTSASIVKESSSIDPVIIYSSKISEHFDMMLESAEFTFLEESIGKQIDYNKEYEHTSSDFLNKFNEQFHNMSHCSVEYEQAKKQKKPFKDIILEELTMMSKEENDSAERLRQSMQGAEYCTLLNNKEILNMAEFVSNIGEDTFYSLYNSDRKTLEDSIKRKLYSSLANSTFDSQKPSEFCGQAATEFMHYALSKNGVHTMIEENQMLYGHYSNEKEK